MSIHPTPTTFTAATAEALQYTAAGTAADGWTMIDDQLISTGRWAERRWLIVSNGAGTYGVRYEDGLTEEQEATRPWENVPGDTAMELVPLVGVPVTTTKYLTEVEYEAHLKKGAGR